MSEKFNETDALEKRSDFNSATARDSIENSSKPALKDARRADLGQDHWPTELEAGIDAPDAKTDDLDAVNEDRADRDRQSEGHGDEDQADRDRQAEVIAQSKPKRGAGAPFGNVNALKNGLYSKALKTAKRGPLRPRAKRKMAETLQAVLNDQGNVDNLSATLQFVIARFASKVARLSQMEKAVESVVHRNPQIIEAPNALAKVYAYLAPIEDSAIADAKTIGFQRVTSASGDPLKDYVQARYSEGKDGDE